VCGYCVAFTNPLQFLYAENTAGRKGIPSNRFTNGQNIRTIDSGSRSSFNKQTSIAKSQIYFSQVFPGDDNSSKRNPYSNESLDEKIDAYFSSSSASSYVSTSGSSSDSKKSALEEAKELRRKAKALKAEAAKAESELKEQRRSKKDLENSAADTVIDELMLLLDMNLINDMNRQGDIVTTRDNSKEPSVAEGNNTSMTVTKTEIPENIMITNFLRKQSLSLPKMINIVKRLHERELLARGEYNKSRQMQPQLQALGQNPGFVIGDVKNTSLNYNPDQVLKLVFLMNCILTSQSKLDLERAQKRDEKLLRSKSLDTSGKKKVTPVSMTTQSDSNLIIAPKLRSQVKELRRADREAFQRGIQQQIASDNFAMDPYIQRTVNSTLIGDNNAQGFNVSTFMGEIIAQPMWVPQSMLGFVIKHRDAISKEDLNLFRTEILEKCKSFYCTSWESTNVAAIYRGNIKRDVENQATWNEINEKLQSYEGANDRVKTLKNRIQLFWINDPEWMRGADERYPEPKPVLFVTGANIKPMQPNENGVKTKVLMVSYFLI